MLNFRCDKLPYNADDSKSLLRKLVYKILKKHIAGTTAASAIRVAKEINSQGFKSSITFLNDADDDQNLTKAKYNFNSYLQFSKEIFRLGINSDISLRLSQLGYPSKNDLCGDFGDLIHYIETNSILWFEYEPEHKLEDVIDFVGSIKSDKVGIELPIDSINDNIITSILNPIKNIKVVPAEYKEKNNPLSAPVNEKTDMLLKYKNTISKMIKLNKNLYMYMNDYKLIERFIMKNGTEKNFTFEIPLGYNVNRVKKIKDKGYNICIYAPYGRDILPSAIDKLVTGRIHDIAINLLDNK